MSIDRCDILCLDLEKAEALRSGRLPVEVAQRSAARAKALADPTRLTLAAALADGGELCVCDLAWVTERSDKLVSHMLGPCGPPVSSGPDGTGRWCSMS